MPFNVSDDYLASLASGKTRLVPLLRVVRADGRVFGFCRSQMDITLGDFTVNGILIPGTTYDHTSIPTVTDIQQSEDPSKVDNQDLTLITGDYLPFADVRKRLFDNAAWTLLIARWDALDDAPMLRARGTIGETTMAGDKVVFKLRSLSNALQQAIINVTSPLSRYNWDDAGLYNAPMGTNSNFPVTNSSTSMTIASSGSISFTTASGLLIRPGNRIEVARTSALTTTWMQGIVTAYDNTNGNTAFTADKSLGSGTHTDWTITCIAFTLGTPIEPGFTADAYRAQVRSTIDSITPGWPGVADSPRRTLTIEDTMSFPPRRFEDGQITFTSGANDGVVRDIMLWEASTGKMVLWQPTPADMAPGDQVTVRIKVPKTPAEWVTFFGDLIGFGGEPDVCTMEAASDPLYNPQDPTGP